MSSPVAPRSVRVGLARCVRYCNARNLREPSPREEPPMKAVRIHQPGSVDNYIYEDAPEPTAGPGEVRVRVRAVALNHLEAWAAKAPSSVRYEQPRILGADVAGTIESVGP